MATTTTSWPSSQEPLDENRLVIDFLLVRAKLREIVATLDHYVLLPTQHPHLHVVDDGSEVTRFVRRVTLDFSQRRLPAVAGGKYDRGTAVRYIGRQLLAELKSEAGKLQHIRIEVDECDGQIAIWEHSV